MEPERRYIERTNFPQARRGYDPKEVDRHLRAVADAVEQLTAQPSVAGVAAARVEAIVAAAEASARQIEESARADAEQVREQAQADAAAHVKRAEDVADQLAARAAEVQLQISEVVAQIGVLQVGVASLAGDLGGPPAVAVPQPEPAPEPASGPAPDPEPEPEPVALQAVPDPVPDAEPGPAPLAPEGARLIALNMALSGTPREETARYLRENYDLEDQDALLDDVYARAGA